MNPADPVLAAHVSALARELRGPVRMRRSMLAETRDGLDDAASALRESGLPARAAAERAVREFGAVTEVAPEYQAELTAAQGRRTALFAVLVFPALLFGWDLLWSHGVAWPDTGPPPALVLAMARTQDVASGIVTLLAVAVLAATWLRRVDPRVLAGGAAVVTLVGGVLCGGAAVVMNVANGPATVGMLATNPLALPSMTLSGLAMLAILTTSTRAFRVATHDPSRRRPSSTQTVRALRRP